jgi:N-acylneuraminate cytidylyltransferase
LHAISFAERNNYFPEVLVLLQPTSPLRNAAQIIAAVELFTRQSELTDMVVAVKATNSNPYYVLFEENEEGWLEKSKKGSFATRQECPPVWEYNGAIYVIRVAALKKQNLNEFLHILKYEMSELTSHDIDTELDWLVAEEIIKQKNV